MTPITKAPIIPPDIMITSTNAPNVFLIQVTPRANVTRKALESRLFDLTKLFVLPTHPHVAPEMLEHRLLVSTDGAILWQIGADGVENSADDSLTNSDVAGIVHAEVERLVEPFGVLQSFSAYSRLSIPSSCVEVPIDTTNDAEGDSDVVSFAAEEAPWVDYAIDSKTHLAGMELPAIWLDRIREYRSAAPAEPNLKPQGKGHVYFGLEDKTHRQWLTEYFESKMAGGGEAERRILRAFAAFQSREGTTASINTYDGQIVTWGSGWGGLGWLGTVMARATSDNAVRAAFHRAGVRYRGRNTYDIVDLNSKRVVTGKQEALEVMRASVPYLRFLIHLARSPETRRAVADAQLGTFFVSAGDISNAREIATQALFNMVSHLKHWQPGYAVGCLEWAVPQLNGAAISAERDKRLAHLIGRYFYGKARGHAKLPDWKQFQGYWRHMKEDGLDCLDDPFIRASAPPTDDPFSTNGNETAPNRNTTPTTPQTPRSRLLRRTLAPYDDLQTIATGKGLLRRGAEGISIRAIQLVLLRQGYSLPRGANGEFDESMGLAVAAFQKAHGLLADGTIGAQTLRTMDEADSSGSDG